MFYDRFESLCKQKNVAKCRVADELHFGRSNVTKWKNSDKIPKMDILQKIADYFDVSVDYLLGKEEKTAQTDGLSDADKQLVNRVLSLTEDQKMLLDSMLRSMQGNN